MVVNGVWVGALRRWRRGRGLAAAVVLAVVLGVAGLLLAAKADAAALSARVLSAWETDGVVGSVLAAGDRVYIGGGFDYVGPYTGSGVPLDRTTWLGVRRLAKINGTVRVAASDGAGGYYVGGDFTKVGALARAHVAHIRADGRVDEAWDAHANGVVSALAVSGSTVYAGGNFSRIGGRVRHHIAALNTRTGAARVEPER
jgi:hypothetical protein